MTFFCEVNSYHKPARSCKISAWKIVAEYVLCFFLFSCFILFCFLLWPKDLRKQNCFSPVKWLVVFLILTFCPVLYGNSMHKYLSKNQMFLRKEAKETRKRLDFILFSGPHPLNCKAEVPGSVCPGQQAGVGTGMENELLCQRRGLGTIYYIIWLEGDQVKFKRERLFQNLIA